MNFFKYTNTGPRKENEDAFFVAQDKGLIYACVADGVGGIKHGKFASNYVVNEFEKYCKEGYLTKNLPQFLTKVNEDLVEIAKSKFNVESVATTFTGGVISYELLNGVHVGDSRVCILRKNGIRQLTQDHNELGRLVREGLIDPHNKKYYPRKNIIENIVGIQDLFKIQEFRFPLLPNDRILFSTDGFHEAITKKEIRDISITLNSLEEFGRKLIIELENRILHDNTTFLCIEI